MESVEPSLEPPLDVGPSWLAKTCPFGQQAQALASVLLGVPHGAERPLTVLREVSEESSLCCERHCKENAVCESSISPSSQRECQQCATL